MICSRRSLVPVTRFSPEASVLLIVSPFVKLSFHFVLPINAFLLSKCKPTLPIGASYSRFSGFHYVSFVNQIRKLLSFRFIFYLTMTQYQLKQNERLMSQ